MRQTIITSLVAGLGLGVASLAWAHGDGHQRPPRPGMELMQDLQSLDLTPAQRDSIHGLMDDAHDDFEARHQSLRAAHRDFILAMPGTPAYQAATAKLADAVAADARDMVQHHAELREKVYALLTPEQRSELQKKLAEHADDPAEGEGGHRGHHG